MLEDDSKYVLSTCHPCIQVTLTSDLYARQYSTKSESATSTQATSILQFLYSVRSMQQRGSVLEESSQVGRNLAI
jgi:hypothetical protein